MKKRIVSIFLTVVMLFALGIQAFAATPEMANFKLTKTYSAATFKDVTSAAWYYDSVKLCYESALMDGKGAGAFDPTGSMTLAEAIVMADRVHQIYTAGACTLSNGTPWYQPYVEYAVAQGIIKAGDFSGYTAKATRAQMAYIFSNALPAAELGAINSVASVPDVKTTDTYGKNVYALYDAGVLTGSDIYGNFKPNSNITRAEAAAIITRVAFESQRKSVTLFADYSEGTIKFAMPVGTQRTIEQGAPLYMYQQDLSKTCNIVAYSETDAQYSGYSISDVGTLDEVKKQITDSMSTQGLATTITSGKAVKFGSAAAYRYEATTVTDGVSMSQVIYSLISGSTYYEIAVTSVNKDMCKTIDSTLQINGYKAA